MRNGAVFDSCHVELKSSLDGPERTVISGDCIDQSQNQDTKYWTHARDLSKIVMNWEVGYDPPNDMPHVPSYIRHDEQGVTGTHAEIELYNAG